MTYALLAILSLIDGPGPAVSAHRTSSESCLTRELVQAHVEELAHDEWRDLTPQAGQARWPGLRAIGHDARTKQAVLFERGLNEPNGSPRCVERYSFARARGASDQKLVLNVFELVHREPEREGAVKAAQALLQAMVPEPAPGPSGRVSIDEREIGTRIFRADHGWVRPADGRDAGARESVILDLREENEIFVIRLTWARDAR